MAKANNPNENFDEETLFGLIIDKEFDESNAFVSNRILTAANRRAAVNYIDEYNKSTLTTDNDNGSIVTCPTRSYQTAL